MRLGIATVIGSIALSACAFLAEERASEAGSRPRASASPVTVDQGGLAQRGPGVVLVFETNGRERVLFRAAVRALQRVGVWRPLTRGLYSVELETHPGARSEAGVHLADAVLNHTLARGRPRVVCDIRFYPRAIRQELRLWRRIRGVGISPRDWRDYNENEIFDEKLPNRSDFWASILAHELAHCLLGPHGERAAQEWEYKTMRRLTDRVASR